MCLLLLGMRVFAMMAGWLHGVACLHADSFLHSVASSLHSFVLHGVSFFLELSCNCLSALCMWFMVKHSC